MPACFVKAARQLHLVCIIFHLEFGIDDVVLVQLTKTKWRRGFVISEKIPRENSFDVKVKVDGKIFWCDVDQIRPARNPDRDVFEEEEPDTLEADWGTYLTEEQFEHFKNEGKQLTWKTIAFVRHGKSMWNEAKEDGMWAQMKALQCG